MLFRSEQSTKVLKHMSEEVLTLSVEIIKSLISGQAELEKELSAILIKDLVLLAGKRDLDFVNKVLVPVLRMEQVVPICLSPYDSDTKRCIVISKKKPAFKLSVNTLFVNTNLLNVKQKNVLLKTFKKQLGLTGAYKKIANTTWSKIYSETASDPGKFNKFWEAIQNQPQVLIIISGTCDGKSCIVGSYNSQMVPAIPETFMSEWNVDIPAKENSFYFVYEDDDCKHFKPLSSNPFATLYVDYDVNGFISYANDFFRLSWS